MLRVVLLFLLLSGLQAAPLAVLLKTSLSLPDGLQQDAAHPDVYEPVADGFRQGTEPSRRFLVDLNTGLVKEHISEMDRRAFMPPSDGKVAMEKWLADDVPIDAPVERNGGGWVRMEEPSAHLPHGFSQGTEPKMSVPGGFRQGTEPKMSVPGGFSQGTEPKMSVPGGFSQGTEPKMSVPGGFSQGTEPKMSVPGGFSQGTEPKVSVPSGFSQGTEPKVSGPGGFSQGTEPKMSVPSGFSQGTEPKVSGPGGFSQGTEPKVLRPKRFSHGTESKVSMPEGFRQGTETPMSVPVGFRQGTEPFPKIPGSFKSGTEPSFHIPEGFRQGTEPILHLAAMGQGTKPIPALQGGLKQELDVLTPRHQPQLCKGEIISGRCYEFNPTPLAFQDAQVMCRGRALNAELASIPNKDVHTRLVSLVTNGGNRNPVLTWIGGIVKNQQASWVDGSEWNYSDWMPGHPNIHTDDQACVEMFKIDESWWTATDCELKRGSICSYPITA